MKVIGVDGSVWQIAAGGSMRGGTRPDGKYVPPRRTRRTPDWLDELLVRLGQWLASRSGLGRR